MRPPVFLLGAQRSGTTALAHVVSAAVAEQRGGTFPVNGKLWYLLRRWLTPEDLAARHFRADELLHALRRRPAQGVGADAWLAKVEVAVRAAARAVGAGEYPADADGVRRLALGLAGEVHGDATWGDKYNEYLLDLPYLRSLFPDARWLVLYRHPAEVAASMLSWTGDRPWNPVTADDAVAKWVAWNRCWVDQRDTVPSGDVLEVDYADLCEGDAVDEVGAFLGVDLGHHRGVLTRRRAAPAPDVPLGQEAARVWSALRRSAGPPPPEPSPRPTAGLSPSPGGSTCR